METKNEHTSNFIPKKAHPIIKLFFEYSQLKNLYRRGWIEKGVSKKDCETVAEHSFGVALLSYFIAEECRPDLDSSRAMLLGLIHDLGEAYAGDISITDRVSQSEKFKEEHKAIQEIFSKLAKKEKYSELWLEFEKRSTPEAEFVAQVDKLEMAMQANLYEKLEYSGLDEFFASVQKKVISPELKGILDEIIKSR